jgi:hypothetical protein
MQITLDVPDNVPPALLQQYIDEFQNKLKRLDVATLDKRRRLMERLQKLRQTTPQTVLVSKEELSRY